MLSSQPVAASSSILPHSLESLKSTPSYPFLDQPKTRGSVPRSIPIAPQSWTPGPTPASADEEKSLAMTNHGEQMSPESEEDSFHFGEGEGSESPTQGGGAGVAGDRPRVRAEGPGGQDLKRGARIACLECRSAKIRCSAPNDGRVPCKRCSRHDKECVFEKHRRGRKPGRGNLPKERSAVDARSLSQNAGPYRHNSGDHANSDISPVSSSSYQSPSQWLPQGGSGPKSGFQMHQYGGPVQSPGPFSNSPGMGSRDVYRPDLGPYGMDNGRRGGPSQPSRAYPGPLPHFPQRDQQFGYQPRHPQSPYDMPAPLISSHGHGYQAPLSSSSASSSHGGGFFSPPLPRAETSFPGPQQTQPPRDEHRWGPNTNHNNSSYRAGYSNPRALTSERSPKRQTEGKSSPQAQPQQTVMGPPTQYARYQNGGNSSPRSLPPVPHQVNSSSKLSQASTPQAKTEAQEGETAGTADEEEEEEDELVDEDEVLQAYQDPDVLSRPLQLLAYASTAAARRQTAGGYKDPKGMTAAATLGLISSPGAVKVKSSIEVAAQKATTEPASLGAGGAEPSTLENGNWEYKAGRVRAIRGGDASQSPASIDETAKTEAANAASTSTREEEAQVMEDLGPHLGKRRRSDDDVLPVPSSRRHSVIAEQRRMSKLGTAEARTTGLEVQVESKAEDPTEEQDRAPAGASRKGYFRFSLYASKLDIDDANDPISQGVLSLSEMEDLFDLFFNRINPSNFLFDPFLHSLSYVRARSKFLLTVIGSHAARMSEGERGAELAEKLEDHWRNKLLPEVLIGGYKSIEIAQAFLLASLFHRPTHIIVEDRAWQYLGFAIRTATEVGVNIALAPNAEAQDNEHLSRRLRNRDRLWLSLVIAEGTLSTQFGRPCTLLVKHSVSQSAWWNREDFALPEDAALMCQIELKRIVEYHTDVFQKCVATLAITSKENKERLVKLGALHKVAWQELESWKKTWCPTGGLDQAGVGGSMAMGAFLVRWSPYSRLIYYYWRSHLNSFILQAAEKRDDISSLVAFDSMQCARNLMAILLDETQVGDRGLALAPNGVVVMATYAAVSALRLTKLDFSKHAFIDQRAIFDQVHRLAESLEVAGKTPEHRDGAAAPYGTYLLSVLALFDNDSKSSSGASVASEAAALGRNSTDGASAAPGSAWSSRTAGAGAISTPGYALATADHLAALSGSGSASLVHTPSPQQRKDAARGAGAGAGPNGDALAYALAQSQSQNPSAALLHAAAKNENVASSSSSGNSSANPLLSAQLSAAGSGSGSGMSYAGVGITGPPPPPPPHAHHSLNHHPHHPHAHHGPGSAPGPGAEAMDEVALAGVYASDSEVWGYLGGVGDPTSAGLGIGSGAGAGAGIGMTGGAGAGGAGGGAGGVGGLWTVSPGAGWSGL